jgi:hypothetical protein
MISLNKIRKTAAEVLRGQTSETPVIVAFIDRGNYAIVGVRVNYMGMNDVLCVDRHLLGIYTQQPDGRYPVFTIEKDQLSGHQLLANIAQRLSEIAGVDRG